jgi:hypothetical protein
MILFNIFPHHFWDEFVMSFCWFWDRFELFSCFIWKSSGIFLKLAGAWFYRFWHFVFLWYFHDFSLFSMMVFPSFWDRFWKAFWLVFGTICRAFGGQEVFKMPTQIDTNIGIERCTEEARVPETFPGWCQEGCLGFGGSEERKKRRKEEGKNGRREERRIRR